MKQIHILFAVLILTAHSLFAQDTTVNKDSKNDISRLISSKDFVFKATNAMPAQGRTVQLNSDYSLTIKQDTVIAFLPYYGRAYTAPIGRTTGGIDFTSKKFSYNARQTKKGGWEIDIKPKDTEDVQQLYLTLSSKGYGNLHVTSQNRQTISFNGYVQATNK
jgi:hypothetical protein